MYMYFHLLYAIVNVLMLKHLQMYNFTLLLSTFYKYIHILILFTIFLKHAPCLEVYSLTDYMDVKKQSIYTITVDYHVLYTPYVV